MSVLLDCLMAGSAVVVVALMGYSIWSTMPPSVVFSWHPVLMTVAFPCLMMSGQWMYALDPSWGLDKPSRRWFHRGFMIAGVTAMLAGYICILQANLSEHVLLGYNFKTGGWQPSKYLAHCWIGTIVVVLVLVQAVSGMQKLHELQTTGARSHTYHGYLGKAILILSIVNILLGICFIGWTTAMKMYALLTVLSGAGCVGWPKPEASKLSEDEAGEIKPLVFSPA